MFGNPNIYLYVWALFHTNDLKMKIVEEHIMIFASGGITDERKDLISVVSTADGLRFRRVGTGGNYFKQVTNEEWGQMLSDTATWQANTKN